MMSKKYYEKEKKYWENFYKNKNEIEEPTSFALDSIREMKKIGIKNVIEFGCGNGRDTVFFLRNQMTVQAFDMAVEAVEVIKLNAREFTGKVKIQAVDISKPIEKIERTDAISAVYARFLLHALSDEEILGFFENCKNITQPNDLLFFEYRTVEDASREKVTPKHFRNYLEPRNIEHILSINSFVLVNELQGTGMAKWKDDDAYVARQIFRRI